MTVRKRRRQLHEPIDFLRATGSGDPAGHTTVRSPARDDLGVLGAGDPPDEAWLAAVEHDRDIPLGLACDRCHGALRERVRGRSLRLLGKRAGPELDQGRPWQPCPHPIACPGSRTLRLIPSWGKRRLSSKVQ
jgi:hypothetical protein